VIPRGISQFAALFLFCCLSACQRRETIVEFSLDKQPPTFIGGATCEYGPTDVEKKFYERLDVSSCETLQTKPGEFGDETSSFFLQGHQGEFVSWFGIVRDIKPNPGERSGTLLIENKYYPGVTDCNTETISVNGAGDFETEITDIPADLIPLVLVRVYGAVKYDQRNRPVVQADYVRVWHQGQFEFTDFGEDQGNPKWKQNMKIPADITPSRATQGHYYRDLLGPTADQLKILNRYYAQQTIIQFANIPFEDWTPTDGYAPTEIEKQFLRLLNPEDQWTVQPKPGESLQSSFRLRGHVGQFASWFGIVRGVASRVGRRGGRLLIENKYFDGATDDHPQTVSINGGGDFTAEITDLAEDLPLTLVRVYGPVVREERAGPVVLAKYVRVWRWGEFKFNDRGQDHSNPYWRKSVRLQPGNFVHNKQLSAEYYVDLLGPTAEQTDRIKEFCLWAKPDRKLDDSRPREVDVNPSATP
jgi:hypothetical protein